ncbi:MAG: hypothetical protein C4341_05625, partial [Armatimonadota bacterium]
MISHDGPGISLAKIAREEVVPDLLKAVPIVQLVRTLVAEPLQNVARMRMHQHDLPNQLGLLNRDCRSVCFPRCKRLFRSDDVNARWILLPPGAGCLTNVPHRLVYRHTGEAETDASVRLVRRFEHELKVQTALNRKHSRCRLNVRVLKKQVKPLLFL